MDENRKNTIEVEMTEDDWMELLQVCIDLRVTPDTLIECFCWEVIRQHRRRRYSPGRCYTQRKVTERSFNHGKQEQQPHCGRDYP